MVTGPTLAKQATVLQLLLMAAKSYVTPLLIAYIFPTVKDGTFVNYAPSAISPPAEMQGTTRLGRRSTKVRRAKKEQ